jgi:tetratricopeptide (TPR) repeat protein
LIFADAHRLILGSALPPSTAAPGGIRRRSASALLGLCLARSRENGEELEPRTSVHIPLRIQDDDAAIIDPTLALLVTLVLTWQPESSGVRRIFEENFAHHPSAQSARDLGMFLLKEGDRAGARRALREALRLEESSPRALEDAAALAQISPTAEAEPLYRRAAESSDPSIAGPSLSALGGMRKAAGDRAGAAAFYRRAVTKAEAIEGRNGPTVALLLMRLATVAERSEAIASLQRAVAIDRQVLGPQHPQTKAAERSLAAISGPAR